MYVLDTNVISELRKPRPHGAVVAWFSRCNPLSIFLPAVSVGEIQVGIERIRHTDAGKAAEIEAWLDDAVATMTILPMTGETFRLWARYMHKQPVQLSADAMIAATAAVHGYIVVTRNVRDFEPFAVATVNPFAAS